MKGYRTLLDSNQLHNHPSIITIAQKRKQLSKLFSTLKSLQNDVNTNAGQIKNTLQQAFNKSSSFVSQLLVQIDAYLDRPQQIVLTHAQYQCYCDFKTNDLLAYVSHKKNHHRKQQLNWNSSHFITFLGNALPYNPNHFKIFQNSPSRQEGQIASQLNEQSSKTNHQQQRFVKQRQYTKIKSKIQDPRIEKTRHSQVKVKPPLPVQKDHSEQKNKAKNNSHFLCGQCKAQFQNFKSYVIHLKKHDYIIHPESSHIIWRKKGRISLPVPIQDLNQSSNENFICPCKPNMKFGRKEFISHVLKWHKGITPRK